VPNYVRINNEAFFTRDGDAVRNSIFEHPFFIRILNKIVELKTPRFFIVERRKLEDKR
jgi:hypothetical protein